ncbi:unnamed protein product [Calypogeia fissa]
MAAIAENLRSSVEERTGQAFYLPWKSKSPENEHLCSAGAGLDGGTLVGNNNNRRSQSGVFRRKLFGGGTLSLFFVDIAVRFGCHRRRSWVEAAKGEAELGVVVAILRRFWLWFGDINKYRWTGAKQRITSAGRAFCFTSAVARVGWLIGCGNSGGTSC